MEKIWWWVILFLLVMCCQITTIIILLDKKDEDRRIAEINEQTALMKNEAASLELQNERLRNNYLKVILDAQGVEE